MTRGVRMMGNSIIAKQIIRQLDQLPLDLQQQVLNFTQELALSLPKGVPGKQLLHFTGLIEPDDIQAMSQAIEAGCERIDTHFNEIEGFTVASW